MEKGHTNQKPHTAGPPLINPGPLLTRNEDQCRVGKIGVILLCKHVREEKLEKYTKGADKSDSHLYSMIVLVLVLLNKLLQASPRSPSAPSLMRYKDISYIIG